MGARLVAADAGNRPPGADPAVVCIHISGTYSPAQRLKEKSSMRVSIITGGAAGIGAAVARRLAAKGQCLMLHGQSADDSGLERLKAIASECRHAGARVEWCTGDLASEGTAAELVRATRTAFGPVDAVVHAAGFADKRSFLQLSRSDLERSFGVMAAALHELASSALPDLTRGNGGRVVAISRFVAPRFKTPSPLPECTW